MNTKYVGDGDEIQQSYIYKFMCCGILYDFVAWIPRNFATKNRPGNRLLTCRKTPLFFKVVDADLYT